MKYDMPLCYICRITYVYDMKVETKLTRKTKRTNGKRDRETKDSKVCKRKHA